MPEHVPERTMLEPETSPRPDDIEVEVASTQGLLPIDAAGLAALVRAVLAGEAVGRAAISIAVVDDAAIHRVNRQHLGHDYPTDVISFLLSDEDDRMLAGEIVVSAETASSVAFEAGGSPWDELRLYVIHGLLHLCGYDDHKDKDIAAMRERERHYLASLGLDTPAVEDGRPSLTLGQESASCRG